MFPIYNLKFYSLFLPQRIFTWALFFRDKAWDIFIQHPQVLDSAYPPTRMRGERRSASFRREKPAGLSRALSWLSVSNLSRQNRRIFHSQNELHAVHKRHAYSHTHLHTADEEDDGDDDWVYKPQHKIGEDEKWHNEKTVCCCFYLTCQKSCFTYLLHGIYLCLGEHSVTFITVRSEQQNMT